MSDSYTRISKPIGSSYTPVNPAGKHTYDDSLVSFDDAFVAYDGGDGADYVNVDKPIGSPYTKVPKPTT